MWIEKQGETKLQYWLTNTSVPMLAAMPDGEILWLNEAFEQLLGFSSVELIGRKTWKQLTAKEDELAYDIELVDEAVSGKRTDYQLQKQYKTKNGGTRSVVIDVVRYPQSGEFECFLVAACPLDHGVQFALVQLNEIRKLIMALIEHQPSGMTIDKAVAFAKDHPVVASVVVTFLSVMLFGERVLEILKLFGVKVGE